MIEITNLSTAFSVIIITLLSFFGYFLKIYKTLCCLRMILNWFPMINPYVWPISMVREVTDIYFSFWRLLIPKIRYGTSTIDIGMLVALEALNVSIINISNFLLFWISGFSGPNSDFQENEKEELEDLLNPAEITKAFFFFIHPFDFDV
jgi:uncharacterized protein YggT (Ycf19 family)